MLIDIIEEVGSETGIKTATSENRANLVGRINRAAKEVYHANDFKDVLWEQVFVLDKTTNRIAFPHYVDKVRGLKDDGTKVSKELHSIRFRYLPGQRLQRPEAWREIGRVGTKTALVNFGQITFTLGVVETFPVEIIIHGQTSIGAQTSEKITIPAGELIGTTSAQYVESEYGPIRSFDKNRRTQSDIIVSDNTGAEIATIPNYARKASYLIYQHDETSYNVECVEVLFRWPFIPMESDNDDYIIPGFDSVVAKWAIANIWRSDPNKTQLSDVWKLDAKTLGSNILNDSETGQTHHLPMAENHIMEAFQCLR